MDFEQNNNLSEPTEPQPAGPFYGSAQPTPLKAKKRTGWRIFWAIILGLSVLINFVLFIMLIGVVAVLATGRQGIFTEEVIQAGPRISKIVVISVGGIIDDEKARDIYSQLNAARQDKHIKGLIIRVNSPGGTISGSDQIYNEIRKYRDQTKKPVVAFMQGIAASGGYYTSVACEKIVAEPTTITGSIGVIMGHFVFQELLEEKLGIEPVIIKSGEKKDWPSPFQSPKAEQKQYLKDKLIAPAYERFVQVVAEGREVLTLDDVNRLADGSIYGAYEALNENLIDEIGYLDEAIKLILALANIKKAQVVEYRRPFSFAHFLNSRNDDAIKFDRATLYELITPELLYLWSAY